MHVYLEQGAPQHLIESPEPYRAAYGRDVHRGGPPGTNRVWPLAGARWSCRPAAAKPGDPGRNRSHRPSFSSDCFALALIFHRG
jgi:hypothetical protein